MKAGSHWQRLASIAAEELAALLKRLPSALRDKAERLPVTLESVPSREAVQDGIEPDTLGLFVGESFSQFAETDYPLPPQIILYLENIWDESDGDDAKYRHEVRQTLLHEFGHYLGLDESALEERNLE
jgi:predicted Zn-dependent protease with MMP-like domain